MTVILCHGPEALGGCWCGTAIVNVSEEEKVELNHWYAVLPVAITLSWGQAYGGVVDMHVVCALSSHG